MDPQRMRQKLFVGLVLILCLHVTSGIGFPQHASTEIQSSRLPRPQTTPLLKVQNLSPELEKILKDWEIASANIKKLQGEHYRYVYDYVFLVEKQSMGIFYYEAPDKGRIDLVGRKVKPGTETVKEDPNTGKPVNLRVQAHRPEKWICDGKHIWMVSDIDKTVEKFPIPQKNRGTDIIDGPLPFLFGMPAEKAKRRYFLKLLKSPQASQVWLEAKPRWRQDSANYRKATVILNKETFLPVAVQLIDPTGNKETVFMFRKLVPNKPRGIFGFGNGNPFNPKLRGYRLVQKISMPSLIGFHWKKARKLMKKSGCLIEFRRGRHASDSGLAYIVYDQEPHAGVPLTKGQKVVLTIYDEQAVSTSQTDR